MRRINNKKDKALSIGESVAKPHKQKRYVGERSVMNTGT